MKKIIFILALLLIQPCFADAETKSVQEEEMSASQQANLFYADNNLKKTTEIILAIPEAERTAQDWLLLGNILQDEEKSADAQFMYNRAIMIDKNFYKAYYNLGNIYLEEEKPYLAIEQFKKAIKTNDKFAFAYYNLGCTYIRVGELRKAKNALINAIEADKTQPDFYYNLAYVYKKLGKEKASRGFLDSYQKALELKAQQ